MSTTGSPLVMLGAREAKSLRRDDFYRTPVEAIEALCSVEKFVGQIWEPACGDGAISSALVLKGYEVVSTDLVDRGFGMPNIDFLMERVALAPNIVTNPPFKLAEEFAYKAVALTNEVMGQSGKVALLARLGLLEGQQRRRMFLNTPLARVWVFSKRLPMMHRHDFVGEKSSSAIAFAWFVWDHAHNGPPTLGWLP